MTILAIILSPLLTVFLLPIKTKSRNLFYLGICALTLANITLLLMPLKKFFGLDLGWGFTLMLDRYSWFFALVINLAWLVTSIYSHSYIKYNFQQSAAKFHLYISIVLSLVLATNFAGNLFTLFVFYVLSIPFIYPLLILRANEEAYSAGKNYLKATLIPAFCILLPAIIVIYSLEGHFNFGDKIPSTWHQMPVLASIILAAFVVGISKNCVIPFNEWLPKTMSAPAPVSALVHSVAAVKSGSIALVKIAVYVYGLDFLRELTANIFHAGLLIYLCGFTAIYAAYRALQADTIKVRFSYSTVSQLSYIITAILIATPTSIEAAMMHILTHAIAKICLFFVAGFYNCVYNTASIAKIGKLAPQTPFMVLCVAICGASIAGFPFLAGYFSKDLMLLEELHSGNYAAAIFLLVGSLMNFLYIIPLVKNYFQPKDPNLELKAIPRSMFIAMSLCLILIAGFSLYTYYIIRLFEAF